MKKQFRNVCIGNLALILISGLLVVISGGGDQFILSMGIILLLLSIANIFVAAVVAVAAIGYEKLKGYAPSMLLFAAITLLCSFTCCSIQPLRL